MSTARFQPRTGNFESRDVIGIAKLVEGQLKGVIDLIKRKSLLKEPAPVESSGRGIVISAGGKYLDWGWVNCRWTRHFGCQLPIQVWYLGPREMPDRVRKHFLALDVELVDAHEVRRTHSHRKLEGWSTKQYAAMRCPWREVLSLDADAFILRDPAFVLDDAEFQEKGAFFVADVNKCRKSDWGHFYAGLKPPEKEFESGYFAWDRVKAWEGIKFTHWVAEHSEIWDRILYGDKSRAEIGFGTTGTPYVFADQPQWVGSGIKHFWRGEPICIHGMAWKRGEHPAPSPLLPGFFDEWRSKTG